MEAILARGKPIGNANQQVEMQEYPKYHGKDVAVLPSLLQVTGVTKRFGGLVAVDEVSMNVSRGQIHGLVGPNGSGKTTLFALISGLEQVDAGSISFEGQELTRLRATARSYLGIARTFQIPRLFLSMTALENVLVAFERGYPLARAVMKRPHSVRRAEEVLQSLQLYEKRNLLPSQLSYGEQKRLELARALAQDAKLLLLDEPMSGLHPEEVASTIEHIVGLPKEGKAILVIEHNMRVVADIAEWVTVLNFGKKIAEGKPQEIASNSLVSEAYLGSEAMALGDDR